MTTCYFCEKPTIRPSGFKEAKILIIQDEPHASEYKTKKKVSRYKKAQITPLIILRKEFFRLGVDLVQTRRIHFWQHAPNKDEKCFQAGVDNCIEEAKGRQAILLAGAEVVKYFTGYNVSDVNGLQVECNAFSSPIIFACVNPAIVFNKGVGELRFSIENFVKKLIEKDVV